MGIRDIKIVGTIGQNTTEGSMHVVIIEIVGAATEVIAIMATVIAFTMAILTDIIGVTTATTWLAMP